MIMDLPHSNQFWFSIKPNHPGYTKKRSVKHRIINTWLSLESKGNLTGFVTIILPLE